MVEEAPKPYYKVMLKYRSKTGHLRFIEFIEPTLAAAIRLAKIWKEDKNKGAYPITDLVVYGIEKVYASEPLDLDAPKIKELIKDI